MRSGNVVVVSLDNCSLTQRIEPYGSITLSTSLPKPACYACAAVKIDKRASDYSIETLLLAIGTDGKLTLQCPNGVGGIDAGNRVFGQLVYVTGE